MYFFTSQHIFDNFTLFFSILLFFLSRGTGTPAFYSFSPRLSWDIYRQVMMEMIPEEDYTDENQSLYLFVKDIDK